MVGGGGGGGGMECDFLKPKEKKHQFFMFVLVS